VYGGRIAGELISALGRVWTTWLKFNAHSLAIDDLLLTNEADKTCVWGWQWKACCARLSETLLFVVLLRLACTVAAVFQAKGLDRRCG
jgi:hypothetical protein